MSWGKTRNVQDSRGNQGYLQQASAKGNSLYEFVKINNTNCEIILVRTQKSQNGGIFVDCICVYLNWNRFPIGTDKEKKKNSVVVHKLLK